MPNLGHNIKKVKSYRYLGVKKFGEIKKTEVLNVYVEKYYPSGYLISAGTYQADGSGGGEDYIGEDGMWYPHHKYSLIDWLTYCRKYDGFDIVNYTIDDRGNCTMTAFRDIEDTREHFEVYIREYEYYK